MRTRIIPIFVMLILMAVSAYATDYPLYRALTPADFDTDVLLLNMDSFIWDDISGSTKTESFLTGVNTNVGPGKFENATYFNASISTYNSTDDTYDDVSEITDCFTSSTESCSIGFWIRQRASTNAQYFRLMDDIATNDGFIITQSLVGCDSGRCPHVYIFSQSGGMEIDCTIPNISISIGTSTEPDDYSHLFFKFNKTDDTISTFLNGTLIHKIDTNDCDAPGDLSDEIALMDFSAGGTNIMFGNTGSVFMDDIIVIPDLSENFILEEPVGNLAPVFVDICHDIQISHIQNLFCEINATDPENDTLTYYVNDSRLVMTGNNLSDNPSISDYNMPDGWEISVNVTDGLEWTNFTFTYKISDAGPAITDICSLTNISHSQYLDCKVNATDPESDPLTFYVNDSRVTMNATTGVLYDDPVLSDYNLPDCWDLTVNVTDTIGWSDASFVYCVYDTAPVSTVKNITPSPVLAGTWPTLYVNITDVELDDATVVNISWHVNGVLSHMDSWSDVVSATMLNTTYSGIALAGGDVINISIFANDSVLSSNITLSYIVGYSFASNTSLAIGACPSDIPSQMSLWLVVIICLFLIMAGILSAGFFSFFGGLGLLVVSWTLVGCSGMVGWIVALVGLATMIWSVAIKDPVK